MGKWGRLWRTTCCSQFSSEGKAGIKVIEDDVLKSPEDDRNYRCLELTNGLRVLLISDPSTAKAAISLDVHIGHMCDPAKLPGLAHLCEHMLFMASSKAEASGDYQHFLSQHAGSSNAYTSQEHTNFHLDIDEAYLPEALHRFLQFFLHPVFSKSAMETEINTINAENEKNITNDQWRLFQLGKSTAKSSHAYCKFCTGNKWTLESQPKKQGVDTFKELVNFHRRFYSSNVMGLAVLGKGSLDDVETLVAALFSQLPKRRMSLPYWSEHPYGSSQVKIRLNVVPVKDMQNLLITWPLADFMPYYKVKPGHYLGHVVGHQGPGSLLSFLKKKGWVNVLAAAQKIGARGFMFFCISLDLSDEGFDHIDDVVTVVFQYLNMLRDEGPVERIYTECKDVKRMRFRFKDKERPREYVSDYAELLYYSPLKEVLTAPWLMEHFDSHLITRLLKSLTSDNIRLIVRSKKYKGQTNLTERWYGTEYSRYIIPDRTTEMWRAAGRQPQLTLPPRNEFIPTKFDLAPPDTTSDASPRLLLASPLLELWYQQDLSFHLPKTCVTLSLTSPRAYMSAEHRAHCEMTCNLLRDSLQELTYTAYLAGIVYDVHSTQHGITVAFQGYTDTLHLLMHGVLKEVFALKVDNDRLKVLKEKYRRTLENLSAEAPHQQATYHMCHISSDHFWTKPQLLDALSGMTVRTIEDFLRSFFMRLHIELLVYGNTTAEEALDYASMVRQVLEQSRQVEGIIDCSAFRVREVNLPHGCHFVYRRSQDVPGSAGAVTVYLQCGTQETRQNVLLEFISQLLSQHCYETLRTREQLGYIVTTGVRRAKGVQGMRLTVQSNHPPTYVEHRIHVLLSNCKAYVRDMPAEVFENHRKALALRRLEKPKNMGEQNARHWTEISSNLYQFDRDTVEVECLRNLTKDDILTFFEDHLQPGGVKRRVLSVHLLPSNPDGRRGEGKETCDLLEDGVFDEPDVLVDVDQFKGGLSFYPPPAPHSPAVATTR